MNENRLGDRHMLEGLRGEVEALDDLLTVSELQQAGGGFARILRLRTRWTIAQVSQDTGLPMGTIAGIEAGNSWASRGYLAWLAIQVHDLDSTPARSLFIESSLLTLLNKLMHLLDMLRDSLLASNDSIAQLTRVDWNIFLSWDEVRETADAYHSKTWPGPYFPPYPRSRFMGREAEIDKLADWLCKRNTRTITLLGPMGIGKTRLIQELVHTRARMLSRRFNEASYVDLGLLRSQLTALASQPQDQELLTLSAIAHQLSVTEMQGQPLMSILGEFLRPQRLLLVLDNVEYPQTIMPLLKTLEGAHDLRIIIVARSWDQVWPRQKILDIGPLDTGNAVYLFKQRAGEPIGLPESSDTDTMIEQICHSLHRHPLLIKLIAASHKIYDLPEIYAQICALLPNLADGMDQEAPLPEVVRLAVSHFDANLQELLAYLSIFPASFTLEAAQAVCKGDGSRAELRKLLADLTEYHLARGDINSDGRRYTLQDVFREHMIRYSPQGLVVARQRFIKHFLAEAERAAQYLTLPANRAAFTKGIACFTREYPNMRAALDMALTNGDDTRATRLGAALWRHWWSTGSQTEGRIWLDKLRNRAWPFPRAEGAQVLAGAAAIEHALGNLNLAYDLGKQACQRADGANDPAAQATAHIILGVILIDYANPRTKIRQVKPSIPELEQGVALARIVGDAWLEALGMYTLGRGLSEKARLIDAGYGPEREPDLQKARKNLEESLELSKTLNDTWLIATIYCWLGRVAAAQGQFDEARRYWDESRWRFESIPHSLGVALVIYGLADLAYENRDYQQADTLTKERLRIEANLDHKQGIASCMAWQGRILAAQAQHQGGLNMLLQSLALYQEIDDPAGEMEVRRWLCEVLYLMAEAAFQNNDLCLAAKQTRQRLQDEIGLRNRQGIASGLAWLGRIALAQGDRACGGKYLQRSLLRYQKIGDNGGVQEVLAWMQESGF